MIDLSKNHEARIHNKVLGDILKLCRQKGVSRWIFNCQRYLISLFSKNVNKRVGGQRIPQNGERSLRMTPYKFLFLSKWTQLCMQQNSVMETWYFNDVASKSAVTVTEARTQYF